VYQLAVGAVEGNRCSPAIHRDASTVIIRGFPRKSKGKSLRITIDLKIAKCYDYGKALSICSCQYQGRDRTVAPVSRPLNQMLSIDKNNYSIFNKKVSNKKKVKLFLPKLPIG
jgi:hypothetical protein